MRQVLKVIILFASWIISICYIPVGLEAQSFRYWTRNFNDESSLLAGAVVGGGIGPSAIYFNPASISEATNSSLSINASLFSINFFDVQNAMGKDLNLSYSHFQVHPRFISYLVHPRRNSNFSIEFAFLNNETYKLDLNKSTNQYLDILKRLPGDERYFATFQYYNAFREDWIGMGASWSIDPRLSLGISMFATIKSLEYRFDENKQAVPLSDTVQSGNEQIPFYSAAHRVKEYIHFNDYRLLWKIGFLYKSERFSAGVVVRTPSVQFYSDGKRILHEENRDNIGHPYEDDFLGNYRVMDYKEKKDVRVNFKDPLSFAAGLTLYSSDRKKALFTTVEYFLGIPPYQMIHADALWEEIGGGLYDSETDLEWMTYYQGARDVFNTAIGFRWTTRKNVLMMGGIRTDLNYRKNSAFLDDPNIDVQRGVELNVYHLTYGARVMVLGQELMAGVQYSFGTNNYQKQFINLVDPVEYNVKEGEPLVGERSMNMKVLHNSISIYFGAKFNFGAGKLE